MSQIDWSACAPLQRVLLIGAHPDDIEIGCGGSVLTLRERYPDVELHWAVLAAHGSRREEAEQGARQFAGSRVTLRLARFEDGYLPYEAGKVKEYFEAELKPLAPDLVFTHHDADRHQDHRLLAELTWQTFRGQPILEYEIPKYDGDLLPANVFVPLSAEQMETKAELLLSVYASQRSKRWFDRSTFAALARLRGVEAGGATEYAEAFHARKLRLRL